MPVKASIVVLAVGCSIVTGCGGRTSGEGPTVAAERDVARQFAEAIFRGQTDHAVGLLVDPHDPALSWLAKRAARPWRTHHASVRLPGRRSGRSWAFRYQGTRTHSDGSFEEVRGDIMIVVAASARGTGVEFFALRQGVVRFGTHHDSLLMPSNR